MKLELGILVGAESKQWLADLTAVVERLEAVTSAIPTPTAKAATTTQAAPAPKKTLAPVKKGEDIEENDTFDLDGEEPEAEEDETEKPVLLRDVVAACKANREKALKILKKMKLKSIHELKPTDYRKVLSEIGA